MRVYAMLLGLGLTVGYGFAAELAVSSIGASSARAAPAPVGSVETERRRDSVWYGGVLAPITVEAKGDSPSKTAVARRRLLDRVGVRCLQPSQRRTALL